MKQTLDKRNEKQIDVGMKWNYVDFSEIVNDITGGNRKFQSSEYLSEGINPIIDQSEVYVSGYTNDNSIVKRNSPVVVFGDHTKCLKYVDFDFCLGADGVKILEPEDTLDAKFLYYYLSTIKLPNVGYSRHFKFLKEIQIPLPPLPIQKRIAEILDAADALRKKDQELLKKYDELAQAIFIDMFGDPVKNEKGWERKKLGEIQASKSQNGLYVSKENYSESDGVEMVHMSDAFYGKVIQGTLKKVIISESEIRKYKLSDDDLLVARRSLNYEGAVKPCLVETNGNPLVYESSLIRIIVNRKVIDPLYLFYFLSNERAKKEYILKYVTKSTISGINNENLNKVEILVPPLKIQQAFKSRILELKNIVILQPQSKSNSLFNSLLSSAFSGELVS